MPLSQETCWTLIRDAARGTPDARAEFARRYLPVVRAYLAARWGSTQLLCELEDAVQEVFLDCFRSGGILERADPEANGGGFRGFLCGAARIAALHVETRRAREHERRGDSSFHPDRLAKDEETLSRIFDRAWAQSVMRDAADLQTERARVQGEDALQRVELLRLRFHERLPIREVAALWGVSAARLHHEYARARDEFMEALREVVRAQQHCPPEHVEDECRRLLELLR